MFDQFIALLLVGLGVQSTSPSPVVRGETTANAEVMIASKDRVENREEKEAYIRQMKEAARKNREAYKASLKLQKETFRTNIEASRAAYKQSLKETRETFIEETKAKREEVQETLEARREAFTEKLRTIRDEKKKDVVENIQERMLKLNTTQTDAMLRHLNKMSELLGHILEKVEEQKAAGKDTASVETGITAADAAITRAQAAVVVQAGKQYVITITSEENLRADVNAVRRTLEADLKATHQMVVAARKAVSEAITALARLRGEPVPEAVIK